MNLSVEGYKNKDPWSYEDEHLKSSKESESWIVIAILIKYLFSLSMDVGQRLNHISSLCLFIIPPLKLIHWLTKNLHQQY